MGIISPEPLSGGLANVILYFPFFQGTTNQGDYAVEDLANPYINFYIPDDFVALVRLVVRSIAVGATGSVNASKDSEYAGKDEAFNTHSQFTQAILSFVSNEINEFDVSDAFTSISAGDSCGLRFNTQAAPIEKLGLVMEYSR